MKPLRKLIASIEDSDVTSNKKNQKGQNPKEIKPDLVTNQDLEEALL